MRQDDLRGGTSPWTQSHNHSPRPSIEQDFSCDILIVGGGITGSMTAEHLTSLGHEVCLIDRQKPGLGSTAASTAMLLWEIDRSLSELTELYGFDRAANIYRRSESAVRGLIDLITTSGLPCAFRPRHSLLLAGTELGPKELLAEHELRSRAGLPGAYFDHRALLSGFEMNREAAIISPGSAEADPLLLSQALLASAVAKGAKLFDAEAIRYDNSGGAVAVTLEDGHVIEAREVILATGYVMPDFVHSALHRMTSSWAMATPRQAPGAIWRDGVLIWEASKTYTYARTTIDDRIVIGGEDDDALVEPEQRDAVMPQKAIAISAKLHALWPRADATADFIWSGAFGTTTDGLPLIGPVPLHPHIHAAYGYGGNGITFSYLASRMIAACLAGHRKPWFEDFALDRDAPKM